MFDCVNKGLSQQLRKIETKFKKWLSAETRGVLWDPTVVLKRQLGTEGVKIGQFISIECFSFKSMNLLIVPL